MAGQSDGPLHEGRKLIGELAADVNQVILVPVVAIPVVLPLVLDLLPDLALRRRLIASFDVGVVGVTAGVTETVLQVGRLPVALQKQVCDYCFKVLYSLLGVWVLAHPFFVLLAHKNKGQHSTSQTSGGQLGQLVEWECMIKRTISTVFGPPEGVLEHQINTIYHSAFLVIKNDLLGLRNTGDFDLVDDSNRNGEENMPTNINFIGSFHINFNFFVFFIVLNFDYRRIHENEVFLIDFRPVCLNFIDHLVMHMVGDGDHAIFDSHSVNSVLNFAGIVSEKLQAAVIVEQLHHAKLVPTHALKGLNLIKNLIGQLLIFQLAHDKISDRESIISVNKLIKSLIRLLARPYFLLYLPELVFNALNLIEQHLNVIFVVLVVFSQGPHLLVFARFLPVDGKPVVILGEYSNFELLEDLQHELMLLGNPSCPILDGCVQHLLVAGHPFRVLSLTRELALQHVTQSICTYPPADFIGSLQYHEVFLVLGQDDPSLQTGNTRTNYHELVFFVNTFLL